MVFTSKRKEEMHDKTGKKDFPDVRPAVPEPDITFGRLIMLGGVEEGPLGKAEAYREEKPVRGRAGIKLQDISPEKKIYEKAYAKKTGYLKFHLAAVRSFCFSG